MSYVVNLSLKGRPVLVAGGGRVASRKAHDLRRAGAEVTVVAPEICPEIEGMGLKLLRRPYSSEDLRGKFLAIAATDDEELNARISHQAQAKGILVNVVDRPALCTFTLPAVVRRGHLTIAVSTEGQCPALASVLREELEERFGPEWARAVEVFGAIRREMVARGSSGEEIREAVRTLYSSDEATLAALIRKSGTR
ncbi:MAG: bifunctional precorrin-2 dehydrogenase/sirohydrochlorin ferrochelatase [Acidobacteriia bacterium]|nr:bifunctional precorrin-2 dehydrogenase/sirohydrochlorin ferrochelatase [Terriglobia bacterium]